MIWADMLYVWMSHTYEDIVELARVLLWVVNSSAHIFGYVVLESSPRQGSAVSLSSVLSHPDVWDIRLPRGTSTARHCTGISDKSDGYSSD